ncbi:MAG TPA: NERD domain-containing protein, partial [Dehalococcoidia bacterium]|nr:NERD domain-containing protein [Dehalococcoidia bacterium]
MAHLIPADISKLELTDSENPEHETLAVLHAGLSDDYSVFHSVHWSRSYERYTVFGEIDFVIVNQSGDVLLIEQKNGKLEETDQGLVKWYGSEDKSVVGQMNRSLNQIRNKFQYLHGKAAEPNYFFVLYCPDYRVKNVNAAGLDEDCIIDATSKSKLSSIVEDKLGAGTFNEYQRKRVVGFFAQSYHLVIDIHAREAGLNKRYKELASNLVEVIRN